MAILVQITGDPASRKTTGGSFLVPKNTFWIDADGKGLPWTHWKRDYVKNVNYFVPNSTEQAINVIKKIAQQPEITAIVVDTINALMTNAEMDIYKNQNSRDAWSDLAADIYELYKVVREIQRDDLVVFVLAHPEYYDVNGITKVRTKTNGRKLSKIILGAFLNYNFRAELVPTGDSGQFDAILRTQTDGQDESRSPHNMFEYRIPNNLEIIRKTIIENE